MGKVRESIGKTLTFRRWNCVDATCGQLLITATAQPAGCATINVQATLGGVSSAAFTVYVDWASTASALFWQDEPYQDPNNPALSGYISNNTLRLVSACSNAMINIAAHEQFPARPGACGGSTGWTNPIPQNQWGSWITQPPGNNAGMFLDQVLYACSPGGCTPQAQVPATPLLIQANSFTTQFIFVGSQDINSLGKYFTAAPNMQVLYTDHGRDESGTWRCPGQ